MRSHAYLVCHSPLLLTYSCPRLNFPTFHIHLPIRYRHTLPIFGTEIHRYTPLAGADVDRVAAKARTVTATKQLLQLNRWSGAGSELQLRARLKLALSLGSMPTCPIHAHMPLSMAYDEAAKRFICKGEFDRITEKTQGCSYHTTVGMFWKWTERD